MTKDWLLAVLIVATTQFTLQDIKNAECGVACRREGYSEGRFDLRTSACQCFDSFDYSWMTKQKRKTLPSKIRVNEESSVKVYMSKPRSDD